MTKSPGFFRDRIGSLGPTCDERLIRNRLVGVSGENGNYTLINNADIQAGPAIVNLALDQKLEAQIAVLRTIPRPVAFARSARTACEEHVIIGTESPIISNASVSVVCTDACPSKN
jgi:hypothetical protein